MGRPPWVAPESVFLDYPKKSITTLAKEHSVARDTVKAFLLRGGVELRSLSCSLGTIPWTKKEVEHIRKRYEEDYESILDIAESMGVGYKAIRGILLRISVQLRNRNTKGLHKHSQETKDKIRDSRIGEKNPNHISRLTKARRKQLIAHLEKVRPKVRSKEANRKNSETRIRKGLSKGVNNPMSRPEVVKKWASHNGLKPNRQEKFLESILPKTYSINVDAKFVIGNKIPDFIDVKRKLIIELFGDYWHKDEDPKNLIHYYQQRGYRALVIWEHELHDKNLKTRIRRFTRRTK